MGPDLEGHTLTKETWADIKLMEELKYLLLISFPHDFLEHSSSLPFYLIWDIGLVNFK